MCNFIGFLLLKSGVLLLTQKFISTDDGFIDYGAFVNFASIQERPCAVHNRLICVECVEYVRCQEPHRFCESFQSVSGRNICICGAYRWMHQMVPRRYNMPHRPDLQKIFDLIIKPDFGSLASVKPTAQDSINSFTNWFLQKRYASKKYADDINLYCRGTNGGRGTKHDFVKSTQVLKRKYLNCFKKNVPKDIDRKGRQITRRHSWPSESKTLFNYINETDESNFVIVTKNKQRIRSASLGCNICLDTASCHKICYDMKTEPRRIKCSFKEQNHRTIKRLVCDHPGCGLAFANISSLIQHAKSHLLMKRLAVGMPDTDQYFRRYWPESSSWLSSSQCQPAVVQYRCPVERCDKVFGNLPDLTRHLKMGHTKGNLLRLIDILEGKDDHFRWVGGNFMVVPPFSMPRNVHLEICKFHMSLNKKCPRCQDILRSKGPKPPVKLHQAVELFESVIDCNTTIERKIVFELHDKEKTCFVKLPNFKEIRRAEFQSLCEDSQGKCFAAVSFMFSSTDLKNLSDDAESKLRMIHADKSNEMFLSEDVEWIKISDICGSCYTLSCERETFTISKEMKEPFTCDTSVKFCRYSFKLSNKMLLLSKRS
uniref:C2H2-type domain-containing protein n=1 Tax=Corethron hystrix TaxID=216773 RepID=A0A7S1B343_9STRA|mmetsp:Transcript_10971/g.24172  ORF Transcript_10971/g.24172 Transcript_10971/m.24172 type:complete len:597 (+) Transcript_10971:92-1882(+)